MEKKTAQQKYRELISLVRVLSIKAISEGKQEVNESLKNLEKYLEEMRAQRHLCMLSEKDRTENVRYEELLKYIDEQYDGSEESLNVICRELDKRKNIEARQKCRELISSIRVLSIRASSVGNLEVSGRLRRIAEYLEEVGAQRHLCMLSEKDRIENVRYNELLEYIDKQYDGTEEALKEICRELDKREDIDEVLKYQDKKNNQSKEEER